MIQSFSVDLKCAVVSFTKSEHMKEGEQVQEDEESSSYCGHKRWLKALRYLCLDFSREVPAGAWSQHWRR